MCDVINEVVIATLAFKWLKADLLRFLLLMMSRIKLDQNEKISHHPRYVEIHDRKKKEETKYVYRCLVHVYACIHLFSFLFSATILNFSISWMYTCVAYTCQNVEFSLSTGLVALNSVVSATKELMCRSYPDKITSLTAVIIG